MNPWPFPAYPNPKDPGPNRGKLPPLTESEKNKRAWAKLKSDPERYAKHRAKKTGKPAEPLYTADQLREYAKKAVEAEIDTIINLLMIQHDAAAGRHNYWHVAANLIKAERR